MMTGDDVITLFGKLRAHKMKKLETGPDQLTIAPLVDKYMWTPLFLPWNVSYHKAI